MIKKIFIATIVMVSVFSCNSSRHLLSLKQKAVAEWKGKIPCADCEGINYSVNLMNDGSFTEQSVYIGKQVSPFSSAGNWTINTDSIITLQYNKSGKRYLLFKTDYLEMLDGEGKQIASQFPMNFKLYKADENNKDEDGSMQNKNSLLNNKWVLQKIGDETIDTAKYSQRIPTLEFQPGENRTFGYGGCNRFSGTITINENNITFGNFISTKMACMGGPDIENRYLKLLSGNTFTYRTDGMLLYLERGGNILVFKKMIG